VNHVPTETFAKTNRFNDSEILSRSNALFGSQTFAATYLFLGTIELSGEVDLSGAELSDDFDVDVVWPYLMVVVVLAVLVVVGLVKLCYNQLSAMESESEDGEEEDGSPNEEDWKFESFKQDDNLPADAQNAEEHQSSKFLDGEDGIFYERENDLDRYDSEIGNSFGGEESPWSGRDGEEAPEMASYIEYDEDGFLDEVRHTQNSKNLYRRRG
jgi:hypothetical protein